MGISLIKSKPQSRFETSKPHFSKSMFILERIIAVESGKSWSKMQMGALNRENGQHARMVNEKDSSSNNSKR